MTDNELMAAIEAYFDSYKVGVWVDEVLISYNVRMPQGRRVAYARQIDQVPPYPALDKIHFMKWEDVKSFLLSKRIALLIDPSQELRGLGKVLMEYSSDR